jgi:protoporphyrinogen oxidase
MNKYDVIIVGGGVSGLVSAMTLLEHDPDLHIALVEANTRLGGRTLTVLGQVNYQFFHQNRFIKISYISIWYR